MQKKGKDPTSKHGLSLVFFAVALFFTSACTNQAPAPAATAPLPEVITILSLGTGSTRYVQASAFRAAVEKYTPMKMRIETSARILERMAPITMGQAELTILGPDDIEQWANGTAVAETLGPQPVRWVWRGFPSLGGFGTRANSDVKTLPDLKGKRIPQSAGDPVWNTVIESYLAYGGLTWKDVQVIPVSGISAGTAGVLEGTIDASYFMSFSAQTIELASSQHGIRWLETPITEKDAWKRMQDVRRWGYPFKIEAAAGLKEGTSMWGQAGGAIGVVTDAKVRADVIYDVVKALQQGYDVYSPMHKELLAWTWEQAYDVENTVDVPYHDGVVKFFKEMKVWSPAHESFQQRTLAEEKARLAKGKSAK